jgi:hypothetical protein
MALGSFTSQKRFGFASGGTLLLIKTLVSGRDMRPFKKGHRVAKDVLPEVKGTTPGKQKDRFSKGAVLLLREAWRH